MSLAARASEVVAPQQRELARELLWARHPEFGAFSKPDLSKAAIMRAFPEVVTVIDYREGFGHADVLTVTEDAVSMTAARPDDWGLSPTAT